FLPNAEIVRRHLRVRVLGCPLGNIDHAERGDQRVDRDGRGINSLSREMERRVDMRAGMFNETPFIHIEAVFAEIGNLLNLELLLAEIGGELRKERMREIDYLGKGDWRRMNRERAKGRNRTSNGRRPGRPEQAPARDRVSNRLHASR